MYMIIISLNFNYDQLCFIKNKIVFFYVLHAIEDDQYVIETIKFKSFENPPVCMGNITRKKIYGLFAVVVV